MLKVSRFGEIDIYMDAKRNFEKPEIGRAIINDNVYGLTIVMPFIKEYLVLFLYVFGGGYGYLEP